MTILNKKELNILGILSGSSLDGLDIGYWRIKISKTNKYFRGFVSFSLG